MTNAIGNFEGIGIMGNIEKDCVVVAVVKKTCGPPFWVECHRLVGLGGRSNPSAVGNRYWSLQIEWRGIDGHPLRFDVDLRPGICVWTLEYRIVAEPMGPCL